VDRARLRVGGRETPIGWVPRPGDLDLSGLDIASERVEEATHIDFDEWTRELQSAGAFFSTLGPNVPKELELQRELMLARIESMRSAAPQYRPPVP
jgi:phosphoenolpyruvate carboxykinase (GTP)